MLKTIEIKALDNGAHRTQNGRVCPDGYAIIPDDIEIPDTFPFVNITTKKKDGKVYVKTMTAGEVPPPKPVEPVITIEDRMDAAEAAILALMG